MALAIHQQFVKANYIFLNMTDLVMVVNIICYSKWDNCAL